MTTIHVGHCLDSLRAMPAGSVHCVVTSPPYFGLRDYGTSRWEGGDASCDHRRTTLRAGRNEDRPMMGDSFATNAGQLLHEARRSMCETCGAVKVDEQLGLEPTPAEFVAALVAVFGEVWRVLADDGTLWLNIGDSYASKPRGSDAGWDKSRLTNPGYSQKAQRASMRQDGNRHRGASQGLKEKDLIGIPWRVAFALQDAGWYLRSDIIWAKPNPMPESVTDRPTRAHEYVFLLTKSKRYHYDAAAVAERAVQSTTGTAASFKRATSTRGAVAPGKPAEHRADREPVNYDGETRNARTIWSVATRPYAGAHFATMPPALAERCIRAGCPEGGTVLDPFGGAGTTALVAARLGRDAVLCELNPAYAALAAERVRADAPLLNAVTVHAPLPVAA